MHINFVLTTLQTYWIGLLLLWLITVFLVYALHDRSTNNPLNGCAEGFGCIIWTLFLIMVGLLLGYFI